MAGQNDLTRAARNPEADLPDMTVNIDAGIQRAIELEMGFRQAGQVRRDEALALAEAAGPSARMGQVVKL